MLYEAGVVMERKPFSIGARIEHLQTMIDAAQYGRYAGRAELGAADYKLAVHLANGRSAYTFCMCPGGEVVAAASEPGRVVTNGMSLFARNKENANAALLVGVNPEDFGGTHPLQGMFWQRELEAKAFELGGGNYHAPAPAGGRFSCRTCFVRSRNGAAVLSSRGQIHRSGTAVSALCYGDAAAGNFADGSQAERFCQS